MIVVHRYTSDEVHAIISINDSDYETWRAYAQETADYIGCCWVFERVFTGIYHVEFFPSTKDVMGWIIWIKCREALEAFLDND